MKSIPSLKLEFQSAWKMPQQKRDQYLSELSCLTELVNRIKQDPFDVLHDWLDRNYPDWEQMPEDQFVDLILEEY
jgi:hypothetical protein